MNFVSWAQALRCFIENSCNNGLVALQNSVIEETQTDNNATIPLTPVGGGVDGAYIA